MTTLRHQVGLRGSVRIEIRDAASGVLIDTRDVPNMVVDTGRVQLAQGLGGTTQVAPTYIALGTSATAAARSQTALLAEVHRAVVTQRSVTNISSEFRYFLPSQQANGSTLREIGLFNAAAGPTMFARAVYTEIVKTTSITVLYVWTIVFDL